LMGTMVRKIHSPTMIAPAIIKVSVGMKDSLF
jgi:hypothetical protein